MLKAAAWYSAGQACYGERQGYSYDVHPDTSIRDVVYRDEPLYKTPEEALEAHWRRHYRKPSPLSNHTKAVLVDMYQAICESDRRISAADAVDILTAEWNEEHIFPPDQLTREEIETVINEAAAVNKELK